MRLRDDFTQRQVVRPGDQAWAPSPTPGVERWMLDRIGGEVARATSIVRYAPNSSFPAHVHGGGEEFLVLEGLFLDAHGAYPAGTYVRNPIGSAHAPASGPEGALLFVKLHQFDPEDQARTVRDTRTAAFQPGPAGLSLLPLHAFGNERVSLLRAAPHTPIAPEAEAGGAEILVLEGMLEDAHGPCPRGTWLRSPPGARERLLSGPEGALLYRKTGHLSR